MASHEYYNVPDGAPHSSTPLPDDGYEMHPVSSPPYSPDLQRPGHQGHSNQDPFRDAPYSPDMQGHGHQRTDSENTFVGAPYSPEFRRPSYKHSFSSVIAPLLGLGHEGLPQLQTRMTPMDEDSKIRLRHDYSSRLQMRKLFTHMLARFIFSTLCCGAIVALFKVYEDRRFLDSNQKHIFNAIYIGISMLLSMNLISAFKSLASMIRWRLLAKHELTLREVDLILALSSFQKTIELLFARTGKGSPNPTATRRWTFRLGAIGWILLGVAAQVDIALIGLTYNHENATTLKPGPIHITELHEIYPDYTYSPELYPEIIPSIPDQKLAAHWFGVGSWVFSFYDSGSPEIEADQEAHQYMIHDRVYNSFTYYFKEWAPTADPNRFEAVSTNRSVEVFPTCEYYPIPQGKYGDADSAFEITTTAGMDVTIDWLKGYGPNETIIVNPYWEGISPEYLSCGDRCSPLYLFEFFPDSDGYLFNCSVKVSMVQNITESVHEMPDAVARIFAGSPGSQGSQDGAGRQFVKYTQGNIWGYPDHEYMDDAKEFIAASKLARFVAGSIAQYDQVGPMINATGMQYLQGVRLAVKWTNLYISLGTILAINFIFGIFIVVKANAVYCKDDSFLSTARLLRPLLERLGDSGSHLNGRKIADTYNSKVVYGYRAHNGIHHLDFGDDIKILASGEQFPDGKYD